MCRRLRRDTTERGRSVISVLEQYNKFVKKAFRDFILPTAVYADIIIPGFRNNRVSVDFIVQNIKNMPKRITFKDVLAIKQIFIIILKEKLMVFSNRNKTKPEVSVMLG